MAILQVQELTHIYGQGTPFVHTALDHVSLSIEKGRWWASSATPARVRAR